MTEPTRYRKKPIEVEAMLWTGRYDDSMYEAMEWVRSNGGRFGRRMDFPDGTQESRVVSLLIQTLEGEMRADAGDWIVRGVKGEFYPCKPGIFDATYERAL